MCRWTAGQGIEEAMFNLGRLAKVEGRLEEAEHWWRAAAQAGDPDAMNSLGVLLSNNKMLDEAERWWNMAARYYSPGLLHAGQASFLPAGIR
jgi:TPR repeat protein